MEAFAVLIGLGLLMVPILLIVGIVKISGIAYELQEVKRLLAEMIIARREDRQRLPKTGESVSDEASAEAEPAPVSEQMKTESSSTAHSSPRPDHLSRAAAKPELVAEPKSVPAEETIARVFEPAEEAVPQPEPKRETVVEPPREPTAIELFWQRVEDWFFVRGEFAPSGTTHEFALATHWLVRVGVVMIIGSLTYFAKLSIDRGWMGPTGRIVATLVVGALGVAAGAFIVKRTRYGLLGHAIAALGIVALYFGFGLGHRFFDPPVIPSPTLAFAALFGVTVVAAILSVCLASSPIAVLALVGGYLVPIIAGRDTGSPLGLDIYLVVINLGAFVVTRFRKWSPLDFLASMLGFVMCFIWCSRHPHCEPAAVLTNFIFLSVAHLIYMASVVFGAKFRNRAGNALAWSGLSLGACVYFGWLVSYFRMGFSNGTTGLVLLGVVAVYLAVAVFVLRRGLADRQTVNILLVFALAFLAIAPAFIFDKIWLTMIWSALAVAMIEAEVRTGQRVLGIMSYLVLAAAAVVGICYVVPEEYQSAYRAVNATTGQYLAALLLRIVRIGALPAATALVARRLKLVELLVAVGIAVFLCYTAEAVMFGRVFLPSFGTGMVTVAWTLAAFVGVWIGISRRVRALRIGSLVLLGVSVAKLLLVDTAHLPIPGRVGVFAIVGVFLLIGAFLYIRARDKFEVHEK